MNKKYLSLVVAAVLSGSISLAVTDKNDTSMFQDSKIEAQSLDSKEQETYDNTDFAESAFSMSILDGLRYREAINTITNEDQKKYAKELKDLKSTALNGDQYKENLEKIFKNYSEDSSKDIHPSSFFMAEPKETVRVNKIIQQMNDKHYTLNLYKIEAAIRDGSEGAKNHAAKDNIKIDDSFINSCSSVSTALNRIGQVSVLNQLSFNQKLVNQMGSAQFTQILDNKAVDIRYNYVFIMEKDTPYMNLDVYNQSEVLIKLDTKVRLDTHKNHLINTIKVDNNYYTLVLEEL